jgi:predicted DNA binding protein
VKDLTPRQKEVKAAYDELTKRNGIKPTYTELAGEMGIADMTAWWHIVRIQKKLNKQKPEKRMARAAL